MKRSIPIWRTKAAAYIKAEAKARTIDDGVALLVKELKKQAYERGYKIGTLTPPFDPVPLAMVLGAKEVRAADLGFDGRVIMEDAKLVVEYDAKTVSLERRRFTLAHETGHLMIFKVTGKTFAMPAKRTAANSEIERLCNKIASEILAPRDEVKAKWREHQESFAPKIDFILRLGEHFSISQRAAALRFQEICLADAGIALLNFPQRRLEWNYGIYTQSEFLNHLMDVISHEIKKTPPAMHSGGSYKINNRFTPYEWKYMAGGRCLVVQYK